LDATDTEPVGAIVVVGHVDVATAVEVQVIAVVAIDRCTPVVAVVATVIKGPATVRTVPGPQPRK
jgi:hypothetical protein